MHDSLQEKEKQQFINDYIEELDRERESLIAQWKAELKKVTDSCMASNVALEEKMKQRRPDLQSKYEFVQYIFIIRCGCNARFDWSRASQ